MDEPTLIALQGSIAKWQAIVDGTGVDDGTENCPLCLMFYGDFGGCAGCPVNEHTSCSFCKATPYEDWCDLFVTDRYAVPKIADTPARKQAAQAEVDFLKSLLPKEIAP